MKYKEILDKIIDELRGTCESTLDDKLEENNLTIDDLDEESLTYFDENIFNCSECGWWIDTESRMGVRDNECIDCNPEGEE